MLTKAALFDNYCRNNREKNCLLYW